MAESAKRPAARLAYQLVLLLAYPWVRIRLLVRSVREPAYGERVGERFARLSSDLPTNAVWFHAVSVGEVNAVAPLVGELKAQFPEQPILVTTMTPAGSKRLIEQLGSRVAHCYAPYDFPWVVARFFRRLRPRALVLVETELWPNLLAAARRRGIPALLVNARLSERSARNYARVGGLAHDMLAGLDRIACQADEHAARFVSLGAPAERVITTGSVKFDAELASDHESRVARCKAAWQLGERPVWLAGSTHPAEETEVLRAHLIIRETFPDCCLVLVPRHPARAADIMTEIDECGLTAVRQSESVGNDIGRADVIVADRMGQLRYLYGLADVAFVGGSLVPIGGHNPIEAALCARPIVMGPFVYNIPDIARTFSDAGCLFQVENATELADTVKALLADEPRRRQLGIAARRLVQARRGARERVLELLRQRIY